MGLLFKTAIIIPEIIFQGNRWSLYRWSALRLDLPMFGVFLGCLTPHSQYGSALVQGSFTPANCLALSCKFTKSLSWPPDWENDLQLHWISQQVQLSPERLSPAQPVSSDITKLGFPASSPSHFLMHWAISYFDTNLNLGKWVLVCNSCLTCHQKKLLFLI